MIEEHKEALAETIKNQLLNLDGPRHLNRKLGAQEQFLNKVFNGFVEIANSLETLEDIAFYMSRFPFQQTRITRERYLQFHVESYLSEIYLLRERLNPYITRLERAYKHHPNMQKQCETLTSAITKSLESIINTRGKHVHEIRFSDNEISHLSTIAQFSRVSDNEFKNLLEGYYREEHIRVRKIWRNRVKSNNKAIRELLDVVFNSLFPIVFDENTSTLRYPQSKTKPAA